MRFAYIILFAGLACLTGCAGRNRPPVASYVKPSLAPVARPVTQARSQVAAAAIQVATTTAQAERAATLAQAAVENGVLPQSNEAKALAAEVEGLKSGLFRVTVQLRDAQEQLEQADTQLVKLDAVVATQTEELNKVNSERVNALADAEASAAAAKVAKGEAAELKRSLLWQRAKTWIAGGGVALLFVLGFAFKLIGAGTRLSAL